MIAKNKKILLAALLLFLSGFIVLPVLAAGYELEMPLPGMPERVADPGQYISYLFTFGLSLIGFLAVGAIVLGGIQYMVAPSVGSVEKSKSLILGAIAGIALLLCSYLLLTAIDPTLKDLSPKISPLKLKTLNK